MKIAATHAVGFDNIDVAACTAAGVLATNTPDVLTETTADTAFALVDDRGSPVGEGERFLRARTPWIWGPLMMLGQDVHHKTIGIVGLGRIGQAVARRAKGFGMRVLYCDAYPLPADVEERGRHAFARHVADRDDQAVRLGREEVVEVAAELARRRRTAPRRRRPSAAWAARSAAAPPARAARTGSPSRAGSSLARIVS